MGKLMIWVVLALLAFDPAWAGQATGRSDLPGAAKAAFKPVTFTDAFGREITVRKPLEKISIGHHFFAEFLAGIGARDLIVTVIPSITEEKIFYPELSQKKAVSPMYESPDFESIIASGAQAYIVNGIHACEKNYHQAVDKLEPGVQVIGLLTTTMDDFYGAVTMLGRITAREAQAAAYNRFQLDVLEMIRARVADIGDTERVQVYFEPLHKGWTVNDNCMGFGYQIPTAGGINIAGRHLNHDLEWFEADKEWLATQNPDIILLRTPLTYGQGYDEDGFGTMKKHILESMSRPELCQSNAVKNKRVYSMAWDLIGTPRMFIGMAYMAKLFYPERFKDMDPRAIHQRYLDTFMKIDFNLSQHGSFIYPAE